MIVRSLFFAHLQDIAGGRELSLALAEGATVRDAAQELEHRYPGMADLLTHTRVAVNAEFADGEMILREGDEVAFMPPMSGGA